MRYLRQTIFDPAECYKPVTVVDAEDELSKDIWTSANALREAAGRAGHGEYTDVEIFDHDGDLVSVTAEALKRGVKRMDVLKRNRDTLYDWLLAIFRTGLLKEGALISTTRPSPLEKKDLFEVIMQAVKDPFYKGFVVKIHDKNGETVSIYVDAKKETP